MIADNSRRPFQYKCITFFGLLLLLLLQLLLLLLFAVCVPGKNILLFTMQFRYSFTLFFFMPAAHATEVVTMHCCCCCCCYVKRKGAQLQQQQQHPHTWLAPVLPLAAIVSPAFDCHFNFTRFAYMCVCMGRATLAGKRKIWSCIVNTPAPTRRMSNAAASATFLAPCQHAKQQRGGSTLWTLHDFSMQHRPAPPLWNMMRCGRCLFLWSLQLVTGMEQLLFRKSTEVIQEHSSKNSTARSNQTVTRW